MYLHHIHGLLLIAGLIITFEAFHSCSVVSFCEINHILLVCSCNSNYDALTVFSGAVRNWMIVGKMLVKDDIGRELKEVV